MKNNSSENGSLLLLPRFRVTCTRTGKNHSFSSPEAAAKFGGGINDWFGWRVDLSNADIEVLLNIVENHVVIGVSLTKESRGKRNIVHFGPTTLKSSIAYCMLKLADIQPGKIQGNLLLSQDFEVGIHIVAHMVPSVPIEVKLKFWLLSVLGLKLKKVGHEPLTGSHMAAAYLGFCHTKQLGVFVCPSGRDDSSWPGYP